MFHFFLSCFGGETWPNNNGPWECTMCGKWQKQRTIAITCMNSWFQQVLSVPTTKSFSTVHSLIEDYSLEYQRFISQHIIYFYIGIFSENCALGGENFVVGRFAPLAYLCLRLHFSSLEAPSSRCRHFLATHAVLTPFFLFCCRSRVGGWSRAEKSSAKQNNVPTIIRLWPYLTAYNVLYSTTEIEEYSERPMLASARHARRAFAVAQDLRGWSPTNLFFNAIGFPVWCRENRPRLE